MDGICRVDWEKTLENINYRLMNKTFPKHFSKVFCVNARGAEYRLDTEGEDRLKIEDFINLAKYLECEIMDLVVLKNDKYISPIKEKINKKRIVDDKSTDDVVNTLQMRDKMKETYEIRTLKEFIKLLPLMDADCVKDTIIRCCQFFDEDDNYYYMSKLNYAFKSIPECKAKEFAVNYRDNILRKKGITENGEYPKEGYEEYMAFLECYRVGDWADYNERVERLKGL